MSATFQDLQMQVIRWAEARKIIPNGKISGQAEKTLEEAGELVEAAAIITFLDDECTGMPGYAQLRAKWMAKYRDAAGDVLVTLINGCALADVDLVSCLAQAYDEIKDRKGTLLPNGVFVKEQA